MIDGHIHIERGEYTVDWIRKFVDRAVETHMDEIWLLEHNFRFQGDLHSSEGWVKWAVYSQFG